VLVLWYILKDDKLVVAIVVQDPQQQLRINLDTGTSTKLSLQPITQGLKVLY